MRQVVKENVLKNILLLLLLIPSYFEIQTFFMSSLASSDKTVLGILLSCVSILSVTACFGNFAFVYGRIDRMNMSNRLLSHVTTGLLMFLIGLSLEMTQIIVARLINGFIFFDLSLLILYVAIVLYDFWDLQRTSGS